MVTRLLRMVVILTNHSAIVSFQFEIEINGHTHSLSKAFQGKYLAGFAGERIPVAIVGPFDAAGYLTRNRDRLCLVGGGVIAILQNDRSLGIRDGHAVRPATRILDTVAKGIEPAVTGCGPRYSQLLSSQRL